MIKKLRDRLAWWQFKREAVRTLRALIASGMPPEEALLAVVLEIRRVGLAQGADDLWPLFLRALAEAEKEPKP